MCDFVHTFFSVCIWFHFSWCCVHFVYAQWCMLQGHKRVATNQWINTSWHDACIFFHLLLHELTTQQLRLNGCCWCFDVIMGDRCNFRVSGLNIAFNFNTTINQKHNESLAFIAFILFCFVTNEMRIHHQPNFPIWHLLWHVMWCRITLYCAVDIKTTSFCTTIQIEHCQDLPTVWTNFEHIYFVNFFNLEIICSETIIKYSTIPLELLTPSFIRLNAFILHTLLLLVHSIRNTSIW